VNFFFVDSTRNHDEWNKAVGTVFVGAQPFQELQTAELRHDQVRNDDFNRPCQIAERTVT